MICTISHFRRSAIVLAVALGVGVLPGLFNVVVDPYRMHGLFDLGLAKKKIAILKHGPLYKVIEYRRRKNGYLLFGDSRGRALREKLFHELGFTDYYNFAYSGGTIAEAIDSFWYAVEHAEVKGAAIEVPLRSMDAKFSGEKNQMPEAVRLRERPLRYFGNLFVADTGLTILEKQYPERMAEVRTVVDGVLRLFSLAPNAASAADPAGLEAGYCEAVCASVSGSLWSIEGPGITDGRRIVRGRNIDRLLDGIGVAPIGSGPADFMTKAAPPALLAPPAALPEPKPAVDLAWQRRIEKGGRNDWKNFTYSEDYYQGLENIADYAKENGIDLVFFIPPTHTDMQAQIGKWNRGAINLEHRRRIAALGPVLDYDLPTEETNDRANFTDPYHFKANVARAMAMDLIRRFGARGKTLAKIEKRRKNTRKVADMSCPTGAGDPGAVALPGDERTWMGRGCVLWGARP